MQTAIVAILCIALIVLGVMTMTQGFTTSADKIAASTEQMSKTEGEIARTHITMVDAEYIYWANLLRMDLENTGETKLASFDKWDVIADYYDGTGNHYINWLPYTSGVLGNNQWHNLGIYLNGQVPVFDPDILDPEEGMIIGALLSPSPGYSTTTNITISTLNGINDSVSFSVDPGYPLLIAHSENTTLRTTPYYELKEGITSDSIGITETTDTISENQTGRWPLYNESDSSRFGQHVYSLAGIQQIPASTWTAYYRAEAPGDWGTQGLPGLSIDIMIREANGTIRQTIATDVAKASITSPNDWQTISATYSFPGYTVTDDTDYLEVDYYGNSDGSGPAANSCVQLRVDDNSLATADQTRVAASN